MGKGHKTIPKERQ